MGRETKVCLKESVFERSKQHREQSMKIKQRFGIQTMSIDERSATQDKNTERTSQVNQTVTGFFDSDLAEPRMNLHGQTGLNFNKSVQPKEAMNKTYVDHLPKINVPNQF